jgi:quinol monooxygenase YgiN
VIFVIGSMTVRDGDIARLKTPIIRQIAVTRAEPGCDHYALAFDVLDPTVIQVSERWIDQPSLGAHLVSDQMVQFNIDFRAAKVMRARIDSFHPDGTVRKLIDVNEIRAVRDNPARVIVMGTASLAPGEIDRLSDAMHSQLTATRAEDGCEHYSFASDGIDPDRLHITERWRDAAALAAHFAAPHMAVFNSALAQAKVEAMSVKAYDANGVRTLIGE